MPHKHIFYVNGTDVSVLSAQEASGYFYQNPVDGSSDFYTNTASSMDFNDNTYTQLFSASNFDSGIFNYKRSTTIDLSAVRYSEFDTIVFNLSGIDDTTNTIVKMLFEPEDGIIQTVTYKNNELIFDKNLPYNLVIGGNTGSNPKNVLYSYDYTLEEEHPFERTFQTRFSAYRQDGMIDEYLLPVRVARDSIYNVADKFNLLDATILPLSSNDLMIKMELENPNFVNHFAIKRGVTPTPTRSNTPTNTKQVTLSRTQTPTVTKTPTNTRTNTKTRTHTPTRTWTPTSTITRTRSTTQQASKSRTPTFTKSHTPIYINVPVTPPPTPSKSTAPRCISKEFTLEYEGLNDSIDPSTVKLGLQYNYTNDTKSFYTSSIESIIEKNSVKVYLPVQSTDYNVTPYVFFEGDDPGITVTNITVSDNCSLQPLSLFTPPAPPETPATPSMDPHHTPPSHMTPPIITTPDIQSVYQFGYGPVVDRPIVVDLPADTSEHPLPPLYQEGPQQLVDIFIDWSVIKTTQTIDQMYKSILSPVDNYTYLPIIPPGAIQVSHGQRQARAQSFDEYQLPIQAPITTSFPANDVFGGYRYFIWYHVRLVNVFDDYEYYKERWVPSNELHPRQDIGYEFRLQLVDDPHKDPDFTDVTKIPACKFPEASYTRIDNLVSYSKWLQNGSQPTYTVTNS